GGDKTYTYGPTFDPVTGVGSWTQLPSVNLPVSAPQTLVTLFRNTVHGQLGLELQAMQDQGKGKLISSPRVLTQDRKEASLQAGQEVPYETATSSGATAIQWKDATTGIKVTPQITPDGNVIMTVKISKNSVTSYYNAGVPILNKKEVETSAMVENGGTMVIGGLYEENNTNDASKVPLLGDIPLLGHLFRHSTKTKDRRELLIFITPRIVDTMNTSNLNY
ncbi:MAG: pilus assembly protein PilQ, partial [Neisseriaceae bacterium]|nr:pilus assembly protein PilQ [Neisseriaceae bacterium]